MGEWLEPGWFTDFNGYSAIMSNGLTVSSGALVSEQIKSDRSEMYGYLPLIQNHFSTMVPNNQKVFSAASTCEPGWEEV